MTLPRPPILLTYINPRPCHPNPLPTAEHLPSKPLALHNINPHHTLHTHHHNGLVEHKAEKAIKPLIFLQWGVRKKKRGDLFGKNKKKHPSWNKRPDLKPQLKNPSSKSYFLAKKKGYFLAKKRGIKKRDQISLLSCRNHTKDRNPFSSKKEHEVVSFKAYHVGLSWTGFPLWCSKHCLLWFQ